LRVALQRVSRASVSVDGELISKIDRGLLLLVGVGAEDAEGEIDRLADKVANLRIFSDAQGKMNLAIADVGGEALVVSQFTLYGDVRKGRRPSWTAAAEPGKAADAVERFALALEARGLKVGRGIFGANMQVELVNDGPVTLLLDAASI
jgi:D-tyrosyl-tRNA(Tyr) deacylase